LKTVICIFLIAFLLTGCEKQGGTLLHKLKFTTSTGSLKSTGNGSDSHYDSFGEYITSITPKIFSAKMNIMYYQDNWDLLGMSTHIISYIDGHDNDPRYEIVLYVDFSDNREVSADPILYSTDIIDGLFKQKEVTFTYFIFVPYYFYQEVDLPAEYEDMTLDQFNREYEVWYHSDSVKIDNVLKVKSSPLIYPIFTETGRYPMGFVFGNTDSTYIFNPEGKTISPSPDFPLGGATNASVIRSNKYFPVTVRMPQDGETFEMYSTISFNTEGLIQVYAGNDNIPYTGDDIFVYAPNYWERINVMLELIE
jgi:hypothetical protein